MSVNKLLTQHIRLLRSYKHLSFNPLLKFSTESDVHTSDKDSPKTEGGFAKAFTKFEAVKSTDDGKKNETFASLLKNSKFMDLGDPEGKVVIGKVFHVVDDDLYIDFGWKFHCVCTRPKKNAEDYVRGSKVKLMIKELELSSKFLGFEEDLTLLEADCTLLGLLREKSKAEEVKENTTSL